MTNLKRIIILFLVAFVMFFSFNIAFATDIAETNLDTENISSDTEDISSDDLVENTQDTESSENSYTSGTYTLTDSGVTSVSQLSSYSEANLELNNILNIILIAIGILIILFAVAILIRLK